MLYGTINIPVMSTVRNSARAFLLLVMTSKFTSEPAAILKSLVPKTSDSEVNFWTLSLHTLHQQHHPWWRRPPWLHETSICSVLNCTNVSRVLDPSLVVRMVQIPVVTVDDSNCWIRLPFYRTRSLQLVVVLRHQLLWHLFWWPCNQSCF